MAFTNNVMIVRHGLLAKLVKLWKENRLLEEIDRLPIELSPRKSKVIGRCCVHKERAVWKYKTLPLLGFDMQDEVDELTPLSEYAKQALLRSENKKENLMCVVDEACSSCVQVNYEITNLCRGCVARSCYMNCPKDAIRFKKNGQAEIDHDTCISCGKCHQNCPYHAIVYIPIPCEEVCPVKAISVINDTIVARRTMARRCSSLMPFVIVRKTGIVPNGFVNVKNEVKHNRKKGNNDSMIILFLLVHYFSHTK